MTSWRCRCILARMHVGVLALGDRQHKIKMWRQKLITLLAKGIAMLLVLIAVLIICVVGAICFWAIEKFVNDSRLANLLKILVVLICVGAILARVLPLAGINWF